LVRDVARAIDDVVVEASLFAAVLNVIAMRGEVRIARIKLRDYIDLLPDIGQLHFGEGKHTLGREIVVARKVNHYGPCCFSICHALTSNGSGTECFRTWSLDRLALETSPKLRLSTGKLFLGILTALL